MFPSFKWKEKIIQISNYLIRVIVNIQKYNIEINFFPYLFENILSIFIYHHIFNISIQITTINLKKSIYC